MARGTKKFMVALSNEKTLTVVTTDVKKAIARAKRWCEKLNDGTRVIDINEVV